MRKKSSQNKTKEVRKHILNIKLCVSGWMETQQKKRRIICTCETRPLLLKVAKEHSQTTYKSKISILGSRAKLCIDDGVNQSAIINNECKKQTNDGHCTFGHCTFGHQKIQQAAINQELNIEDLVILHRQQYLSLLFRKKEREKSRISINAIQLFINEIVKENKFKRFYYYF